MARKPHKARKGKRRDKKIRREGAIKAAKRLRKKTGPTTLSVVDLELVRCAERAEA